jgi:hypothetical protein
MRTTVVEASPKRMAPEIETAKSRHQPVELKRSIISADCAARVLQVSQKIRNVRQQRALADFI